MKRSARYQRRFELLTSPEMTLRAWLARRMELRVRAEKAYERGVNWRGFRVGQSSLCVDKYGAYHIIDSANHKPHRHDDPRHCAEEEPIVVCIENGWKLIAMAMAADEQPDDYTRILWEGVSSPCGKSCRPSMHEEIRRADGVIRPYSRLDRINMESGKFHESTFEEMLKVFGHMPEHLHFQKMGVAA